MDTKVHITSPAALIDQLPVNSWKFKLINLLHWRLKHHPNYYKRTCSKQHRKTNGNSKAPKVHSNFQYHTFDLNCDKPFKFVLRGVIQDLNDKEITEELAQKGYFVKKISRMLGRDKMSSPGVLIEIDCEYKSLYNIMTCYGARCSVTYKKNCNADYKYLKCNAAHSTHLCEKTKTTPAKCCNCIGEHHSNYHNCPKNPNNKPQEKPKTANPWTPDNPSNDSNVSQPQQPTAIP